MKIVHIGYPKTGSTFLQQRVFPQLDDIEYVDFHTCVKLFEDVIYLDDLDFDFQRSKKTLEKYSSKSLFSQEALTGAPYTFKGLNRSRIPHRLKELGFTQIIITVRNQVAIIDSMYRQYIYQGGVMKFVDFLNLDGKWNHYLRGYNLDYLKYDRLVSLYYDVFGKENVLVLPQELLRENQDTFVQLISDFMKVDIPKLKPSKSSNESLSNLSTALMRVINHFTFNSQRPNHLISNWISTKPIKKVFQVILDPYLFSLFSRKRSYLKEHQKERLSDYFAESNFELNNLIDFNLKELGYPIK